MTKAEILKRALASCAFLDDERNNHGEIRIVNNRDNTVREVVLPQARSSQL